MHTALAIMYADTTDPAQLGRTGKHLILEKANVLVQQKYVMRFYYYVDCPSD